jgi:glutamate N-acetyltransferase/amino-acid N-acetyltransferase
LRSRGDDLALRAEAIAASACHHGVRIAVATAGIRYAGRIDLLLALFDPGTAVAGAFTRSKTASAPVDWCRAHLAHGMARALVVNSGNANAFTGRSGRATVERTAEAAAHAAGCREADV